MIFITKMKDFEYYTRIGKESFELRGTVLRQWVSEQMKIDEQREAEEAKKVAEEAKKVAEEAENVRQHELELTRAKEVERQEAEKVRQR